MSEVDIDEELFALAGGDDEDVEEGEASSVSAPSSPGGSIGSDAMEESDSEDGGDDDAAAARPADVLFPLEGKYKDAADKADILSKPQLERERILGERAEQMTQLKWKSELLARTAHLGTPGDDRKRKASSVEPDDAQRKSSRPVKKGKTNDKLEAYRQDRERRQHDRQRNDDRRDRRRSSSEDRDRRSDMDADGESEVDYPEYEAAPRQEEPADSRDFEAVRVGRNFFADVCFNPGFDASITGAFVRVGAGKDSQNQTLYKLAQIKGFTTGKPYVFEGKNGHRVATDQYATVQHGATKKDYPFQFLSNHPLTEAEFHVYKQSLSDSNGKVLTKTQLHKKIDEMKAFMHHQWTEDDINDRLKKVAKFRHMLNSGRSANAGPKLATPAEVEARRIAELNTKNRVQDSERVRKALIEERRQNILQRKQREREYHQKKAEEEAKKKAEEQKAAGTSGIDDLFDGDSRAGTPAVGTPKPVGEKKKEQKGLPTFRKPKMDDDIVASLDLGLEIEI